MVWYLFLRHKINIVLLLQEDLLTGFVLHRLVASIRPGEAGHLVQHVSGVGSNLPPLREHFSPGFEAVVLPSVLHDAGDGFS